MKLPFDIYSAIKKKKAKAHKRGRPAPPPLTDAEEMALSMNR